ncbi:hypothetical protein PG995_012831 [Apiospora arundinis]
MADVNLFISNGTCYTSANIEAYEDYIPCGNAASGQHYQCCSRGDTCLASNACFNNRFRNTYLAGCTDEHYKADTCPNKGEYDYQQWVGLVSCNATDESGIDLEWFGCDEADKDEPSVDYGNQGCQCDNRVGHKVLFTDVRLLSSHAHLPRTSGGPIAFLDGYTPTAAATTTSGPTGALAPNASSGHGPAVKTASPSPVAAPATSSSGLVHSKAALAGIGAGAGVGVILLLIALIFLVLRYRRLKAKKKSGYEGLRRSPAGITRGSGRSLPNDQLGNGGNYGNEKVTPDTVTPADTPIYQQHHRVADNNGGLHGFYKAELPADNPSNADSSADSTPSSPPCTHQEQRPQQPQPLTEAYRSYSPERDRYVPPLSAISERSNETMMMHSPLPPMSPQSPQNTGETAGSVSGSSQGQGHGHGPRSGGMDPIYEMP